MGKYLWNLIVSIDQFFNTLLSPLLNLLLNPIYKFGNPDETISSVMGKNVEKNTCRGCYYLCKIIHWFDKDHCIKSIEHDE
jgi:hypothetical protein